MRHILRFGDRMRDQAYTAGVSRLKAQGVGSSMRDREWPFAIASSVAFIQAWGSTSLSSRVAKSEAMRAHDRPPSSEPGS